MEESVLRVYRLICELEAEEAQIVRRLREIEAGSEFLGDADEFVRRVNHARDIEEQAIRLAQDPSIHREAEAFADFLTLNGRPQPASLRWTLAPSVKFNKTIQLEAAGRIVWHG